MNSNIDNLYFKSEFEKLQNLVYKLDREPADEKIRGEINAKITLLMRTALDQKLPTLQKSLKELQEKIDSSLTATETSKLPKELENIRKVIIPMLSGPPVEEESKRVTEGSRKSEINEIPEAVLSQILEFAFDTTTNPSKVSQDWRALIEPKFWRLVIKEFKMFGIDPNKPPKEAFMDRLKQNVNIYARVFPEIKVPKGLTLLEKYQYFKRNIKAESAGDRFLEYGKKLSNEAVYALLDLNVPLNSHMFRNLSNYSPVIQKELVNRVKKIATIEMRVAGTTHKHILGFLNNAADMLIFGQYRNQEEQLKIDPGSAQFDETLQNTKEAMILMHTKCEELKKRLGNPTLDRPFWKESFRQNIDLFLVSTESTPQLAPLFETYLNLYSEEPLTREFIERVKMLELKDLTEAVDRHPVI